MGSPSCRTQPLPVADAKIVFDDHKKHHNTSQLGTLSEGRTYMRSNCIDFRLSVERAYAEAEDSEYNDDDSST